MFCVLHWIDKLSDPFHWCTFTLFSIRRKWSIFLENFCYIFPRMATMFYPLCEVLLLTVFLLYLSLGVKFLLSQSVTHLSLINWCYYRVPENVNGFLNLSFRTLTIPKWAWTSVQCKTSGSPPPPVNLFLLENQQKKMRYGMW